MILKKQNNNRDNKYYINLFIHQKWTSNTLKKRENHELIIFKTINNKLSTFSYNSIVNSIEVKD